MSNVESGFAGLSNMASMSRDEECELSNRTSMSNVEGSGPRKLKEETEARSEEVSLSKTGAMEEGGGTGGWGEPKDETETRTD